MATLYRCDKCRRISENKNLDIATVTDETHSKGERTYELCMQCLTQLRDWLKPDPQQGK